MEEISLKDMREVIRDMLIVCFEGEISMTDTRICMLLPDGQRFSISVDEDAA